MSNLRPGQQIEYKPKRLEALLGLQNEESALEIELDRIGPFPNHPFLVRDDDEMDELIESVKENGVLSPVLLRTTSKGSYQMVSGHRRLRAAKRAGLKTIPAIVRDMSDEEAVVMMVDSNIQRQKLLPSERAFAYKMRMEAKLEEQRKNADVHHEHLMSGGTSRAVLASELGVGQVQISRYIRLTELIPELLCMVDEKNISLLLGVSISYLQKEYQETICAYISSGGTVKEEQIQTLRVLQEKQKLDEKTIRVVLDGKKKTAVKRKLALTEAKLNRYFPDNYTPKQMKEVIFTLLEEWSKKQKE